MVVLVVEVISILKLLVDIIIILEADVKAVTSELDGMVVLAVEVNSILGLVNSVEEEELKLMVEGMML